MPPPDDFTPLAELSQTLPAPDATTPRVIGLSLARRAGLYRVTVRDSAAAGRTLASALDHSWTLALLHARDRAAGRGLATDAAGAAVLTGLVEALEQRMAAPGEAG